MGQLTTIKKKIVIASVPFVDDNCMLVAPAALKSSLVAAGIDCVALDLNIEIFNKIEHHPLRSQFLDFFYKQKINEEIVDDLARMIEFCVNEILSNSPDIVGLSLFSSECKVFASWLTAGIRQQNPNVKIVIGGPGIGIFDNTMFKYPDRLKQQGLIDDYITGDAEVSLVEYVNGNLSYPGINSTQWNPVDDLNNLPMPDYSDYKLFRYKNPRMAIIDSRGCVQNCDFCDVVVQWKKYQYLTAENIFDQMLVQIEKYKTYYFDFRSSICNGNLREFKKLIKLIANYNTQDKLFSTEKIHWMGSFIIRPSTQHTEEVWQDLKDSNAYLFSGIESLIENVRRELGKNFSNNDLQFHLAMAHKYQVPNNLLFIAGYPGETEADYEFTKQWFRDHAHYANNPIEKIQLTFPTIIPGTTLEKTIIVDQFEQQKPLIKAHYKNLCNVIKECGFDLHVTI